MQSIKWSIIHACHREYRPCIPQLNLSPTIIFRIINDETKQAKCSTISFSSDVKMGVAALSANHHHSFVSTSQSVSKCELSIYLTTLKSCQWPLNLPQLLWITSLITTNCPTVHKLMKNTNSRLWVAGDAKCQVRFELRAERGPA